MDANCAPGPRALPLGGQAVPLGGLQPTSTLDFPGVLCCVLFVRGCDMDCFYCHNRALLGPGGGPSEAEALDFLGRRRGLLDGVVISGGEPTLYPHGLAHWLGLCRALGYKTKLDTNGGRPRVVEALLKDGLLDYVALDVKATAGAYPAVCGGDFAPVAETAALLAASGIAWEARTTLYPGLTLAELGDILAQLPPAPRWRLNAFRMPQQARPRDTGRLARPALNLGQVEAGQGALLALQPGLVW